MSTKICPNCYEINTVKGECNYCMLCGQNIMSEDAVDSNDMTSEEWWEMRSTASKIQDIKAKQCINSFNKDEILNNPDLLRTWYLAFKRIENRLNEVKMEQTRRG